MAEEENNKAVEEPVKEPAPEATANPAADAEPSSCSGAETSRKSPGADKPTDEEKPAEEKPAEEKAAEEKPAEINWKDQYARLLADFDNYKKRAIRDREDTYRYAESDILKDILPTVDNLALALGNVKDAEDPFVKGVRLVYDALIKALKDHGAEPFESVGKPLDPEKMEAIATLPSAEVEEGKVSNEVKRGWLLKDKLLRAAQVVVSSGAPAK